MNVARLLFLIATAVMAGGLSVPEGVGAQSPPPVDIDVRVGFDGIFHDGSWTPVTVRLTSRRPMRGYLEVAIPRADLFSVPQTYVRLRRTVDLTADQTEEWRWVVPLVGSPYPLTATVTDAAGETVAKKHAALRDNSVTDTFILVLDPAGVGWSWLRGFASQDNAADDRHRPGIAYAVTPADVPTQYAALEAFTSIVVTADFPLSAMTSSHIDAITTYVRAGGHLVLIGGAAPPVLPLVWRGWFSSLTGRVTAMTVDSDRLIPAWEWQADTAEEAFRPHTKPIGRGRVSLYPYDPSSSWLDQGFRREATRRIAASGMGPTAPQLITDEEVWDLLASVELSFGNKAILNWGLIVYGAGLIALLAYGRRIPGAPYIIAVWIGIGSLSAAAFVHQSGITDRIGRAEMYVAHSFPPGRVQQDAYIMVASTAARPLFLTADEGHPTPFPARRQRDVDIDAHLLDGQWEYVLPSDGTSLHLTYRTVERLDVQFHVVHDRENDEATLQLSNESPYDIDHMYLIDGQRMASLGSVAAGREEARPYPPRPLPGVGLIGIHLQNTLRQMPLEKRPDDAAIRLLAAIADRRFHTAGEDASFIIALVEPGEAHPFTPTGPLRRWRVLLVPLVPESASGGVSTIAL